MADERNARPAPPPRGMIKIDGRWQIRRSGLLIQRELKCIFGHRITLGDERPFEIAVPCGHMDLRESQIRCDAHVYLFVTRPGGIYAIDLTRDESELIGREAWSPNEIAKHFGVGFPTDMKIARLGT